MIISQAMLKTLYEIIILPITQRVVAHIKKHENVDVFDNDVSYSVWKVREV